jgi:hypothetical protein
MTLRRTALPLFLLVLSLVALAPSGFGQTEAATLSGLITDPQGKVVPAVDVEVTNVDTSVSVHQATNGSGLYVVVGLKPGRYRVSVTKVGFRRIDLTDLVLNVQDVLSRNFQLQLGPVLASITVVADAANVNATDASVYTVIDRNFVESLPLNGRSFNTLLQLTPGVNIVPSSNGSPGQFSIAGQRTDTNNFTIDGVSANFGRSPTGGGASGNGTAQAFSALGGTSGLVSVEALQEFRIETSSYAPELGRSPGGQVILTTRSGTNDFHGEAYEYFRNDVLDANDWFTNSVGQPRAPEKHNDFGGYLGGRIFKDKTFFFTSYEGARLRLPQAKAIVVPSEWARTVAAPPALAPYLNAYPRPDDKTVTSGVYTGTFTGVWSNRATLNAGSVRIDHTFNDRFSLFGRYNDAPSEIAQRANSLAEIDAIQANTKTLTAGLNMSLSNSTSDTLRGNYSTQNASQTNRLDSFGGATPLDPSLILGSLSSANNLAHFDASNTNYFIGPTAKNKTTQFNIVDDVTSVVGTHQIKFGADYRLIFLDVAAAQYTVGLFPGSVQAFVSTGKASLFATLVHPSRLRSSSLSIFAQDSWRVTPRLTVTYGLRWELSPAPAARGATTLASWTNVDNPAQLAIAPIGTPLWGTTYGNFAPRVGVAYGLTSKGDFVLRAGWGLFYDLGVGSSAGLAIAFPNTISKVSPGVTVPTGDVSPYLPSQSLQPPFTGIVQGFSPNLTLPRSYQWNVALEKSFGGRQVLTATYLGQAGRDLLRREAIVQPNQNFTGDFLLEENNARSNYNALQVQYRRPLSARFQALLSYTWSHSLDSSSDDTVAAFSHAVISAANDYASSSFDVRHSFSGALTYAIPSVAKSGPLFLLSREWSIDTVIVARSGLPFNTSVFGSTIDPAFNVPARADIVPGQPLWVAAPNAPGGKMLNVTFDPTTGAITGGAFSVPSTLRQGTEGRNDIPGFGLTQVDLSIVRKFPITERLSLQFRADAFNVFNHPNFANPDGFIEGGAPDLQSSQMLNQSLGGLSPLFQEGGPRSLQLSLKLSF